MVHQDTAITDLTIDGEKIETTPTHYFYTLEYGWVQAGSLWQGAHIRKADGSYGKVEAAPKTIERSQPMYDLTVDTAHTFFVGVGKWLVHNDSCDDYLKEVQNKGNPFVEPPYNAQRDYSGKTLSYSSDGSRISGFDYPSAHERVSEGFQVYNGAEGKAMLRDLRKSLTDDFLLRMSNAPSNISHNEIQHMTA